MELTEEQIERYSRHIILQDVGVEGQMKIANAKVLVIGAGGLGSPILLYLAAAGVGTLGIIDADVVDMSNLQRQVIHFTPDVKKAKVLSAKEKIIEINPDVKVEAIRDLFRAENAMEILSGYDFVIDGTDNFAAKFLINDACVMADKPFSHGGILRFDGQTMTVIPKKTACYRCVFLKPPPANAVPSCSQAGVLGAMAGVLGTLQAVEALKFIIEKGDLLTNRLMMFDAMKMKFRDVQLKKNLNCPICSENPTITELEDGEQAVCEVEL